MSREHSTGLATRFPWLDRVHAATRGLAKEERYLIGVSGGVDSRVLLQILHEFGFHNLVVCHLDHGLRGAESIEDSKFVRRLAQRLGLVSQIEKVTGLPDTGSIEAAAREARLRFFAEAASRFSTESLFLAHHADDQVETFLINLFRGTGSFDNAAIKPESRIKVGQHCLLIRRPLLEVWKDEIYEFATTLRLKYREDSTNVSRQMVRNRVRHDLIPGIEELMGRPIKRTLLRTIELAASEGEFLKSFAAGMATTAQLETRELRKLAVPILRRTIHAWLRNHGVKDCGFDETEAVRLLIDRVQVAKINLPRGVFCRRRGGRIFLEFPSETGIAAGIDPSSQEEQ